ncbi:hypothetical protein Btru_051772 [Bulinus truncatus]|nr:hypothetical protein Btru_051772 [Bulinus truncatus]
MLSTRNSTETVKTDKEDWKSGELTNSQILQSATSQSPQSDGVQSKILRDKLKELEVEIEKFRSENANLEKLRREREEGLAKLKQEIYNFQKEKETELKRLEEFKTEEMKKLKKERMLFDSYQKKISSMPDKKDREEIETLRNQLQELQDELKRKENRWNSCTTRLKNQLAELELENGELKEEIRILEKKRVDDITNVVGPETTTHSVVGPETTTHSVVGPETTTHSVVGHETTTHSVVGHETTTHSVVGPETTTHSVVGPETTTHSVVGPETTTHSVVGPETTTHSVVGPETTRHSVVGHETTTHSVVGPETTTHSVVGPETTRHSVVGPETTTHSVVGPETTTHSVVGPETTTHSVVGPETTTHSVVGPETTTHSVVGPETTRHSVVGPETTRHSVVGPETTTHSVVGPETTRHSVVGPETTTHSVVGPETTTHSVVGHETTTHSVVGHETTRHSCYDSFNPSPRSSMPTKDITRIKSAYSLGNSKDSTTQATQVTSASTTTINVSTGSKKKNTAMASRQISTNLQSNKPVQSSKSAGSKLWNSQGSISGESMPAQKTSVPFITDYTLPANGQTSNVPGGQKLSEPLPVKSAAKIAMENAVVDKGDITSFKESRHPGGKVEKTFKTGTKEIYFPNGTIKEISTDGQTIICRLANGDVRQTFPDHRVVYIFA